MPQGDGAPRPEPPASQVTQGLRALLIAADPGESERLAGRLEHAGYRVESARVATEAELRAALQGPPWDVVIADDGVPGLGILESLAVLRELAPDTPCIAISSAIGDAAVDVMRAGAQDFVVKGRWARLGPAVAREVGEARHRREQRDILQRSELRFRSVVENMGEGLVITDLDDRVVYANPRLSEMVGRAPEELMGKVAYEVLLPRERWHEQRTRNRDRSLGRAEQYETEIVNADGSRRWVQVSAAPSRDHDGRVVGTIGGLVDITERRRALESVRLLNAELQSTAAEIRRSSMV